MVDISSTRICQLCFYSSSTHTNVSNENPMLEAHEGKGSAPPRHAQARCALVSPGQEGARTSTGSDDEAGGWKERDHHEDRWLSIPEKRRCRRSVHASAIAVTAKDKRQIRREYLRLIRCTNIVRPPWAKGGVMETPARPASKYAFVYGSLLAPEVSSALLGREPRSARA